MAGSLGVFYDFSFEFLLGATVDTNDSNFLGVYLRNGDDFLLLTGTFDIANGTGTSTIVDVYMPELANPPLVAAGTYAVDLHDLLTAIANQDLAAIEAAMTVGMVSQQFGGEAGTTVSTLAADELLEDPGSNGHVFKTLHDNVTVNAGDGADTLYAGGGVETLNGEGGDDTFVVDGQGKAGAGDVFDGGAGTNTLRVDISTGAFPTVLSQATFKNIDQLVIAGERKPLFAASQFGSGLISDSLVVAVDPGRNDQGYTIFVTDASDFSAAGWAMHNATTTHPYDDLRLVSISIKGTSGDDTIVGSNYSDYVDGLAGADVITTGDGGDYVTAGSGDDIDLGAGSDTVYLFAGTDFSTLSIDGGTQSSGSGNDIMFLDGAGTYDLSVADIVRIDNVSLYDHYPNEGSTWNVTIGDGMMSTADGNIDGTLGDLRIYIYNTARDIIIDASTLATGHSILIDEGTITGDMTVTAGAGNDSLLTGSGDDSIGAGDGNDTIKAGSGKDTVDAGDGADTIVISGLNDVSALDSYDGGAGSDTLLFDFTTLTSIQRTYDVSGAGAVFKNIEKLHLNLSATSPAQVIFDQAQFGTGLLSNALSVDTTQSYDGPYSTYELHVIELTSFSAADWTLSAQNISAVKVVLTGKAGTSGKAITGSDYADRIDANGGTHQTLIGGDGSDTISGWGSNSSLDGGAGGDYFVLDSGASLAGTTIEGGFDGGVADETTDDRIRLDTAGTYDFTTAASISRIDDISLNDASAAFTLKISDAMAATARMTNGADKAIGIYSNVATSYGITIDASSLTTHHAIVVDGFFLNGGDTITGGADDDSIFGGDGNDSLVAGGGNDLLSGGEGDDFIDGGDNSDTLVLDGDWTDYLISVNAGTYTITDLRSGHSGTDTVTNVETFRFGVTDISAASAVDVAPDAVNDDNSGAVMGLVEAGVGVLGFSTGSGNVLTNDSDANKTNGFADDFTVTGIRKDAGVTGFTSVASTGDTVLAGKFGTLTIHADGSYSYALDNDDPDTQALQNSIGGGGQEVFTYRITDKKGLTDTALLTLNISGSNDGPTITSSNATSVAENAVMNFTVAASDPDSTLTYSISGGDSALFTIDASTGHLTFKNPPDREAPADADHDNIYVFTVTASDGTLTDTQQMSVTVTNVNEAPRIASNGGGASATINVSENASAVTSVVLALTDDGPSKHYSLSGADAALFKISSAGVLAFKAAPDADTGRNNIYNIRVTVTDGASPNLSDFQDLTIKVKNVKGNNIAGDAGDNVLDKNHTIIGGKVATSEEDKIDGKAGNDTIKGGAGNDTLIGGLGKDTLTGEAGTDSFLFNARLGTTNVDTIKDFVHDTDVILLENSIFKTLGAKLDSGEFYAAAGATSAHDANDRIIYNKTTGRLYFDDDGKAGHAAVWFATLSTRPANLDHLDFSLV